MMAPRLLTEDEASARAFHVERRLIRSAQGPYNVVYGPRPKPPNRRSSISTPTGSPTATSLKDFLISKADEYGVRDRNARRKEWLEVVERLLDQIQEWMREADPEGLLDVVRYQVSRSERGYGSYDAPALQVRFGPAEVSIEPISAVPPSYSLEVAVGRDRSVTATAPPNPAGRIDVSNGLRTCHLFRLRRDGSYEWSIRRPDGFAKLDRAEFEAVLKELLA